MINKRYITNVLIQKTLKTILLLNKGLFHSLKMHLLPLWVFLQTEMTDLPTVSYTLQRWQSVVKRGVGWGDHVPLSHMHTPTQIFQNALGIDRWYKQPCRPSCPYSATCASTS